MSGFRRRPGLPETMPPGERLGGRYTHVRRYAGGPRLLHRGVRWVRLRCCESVNEYKDTRRFGSDNFSFEDAKTLSCCVFQVCLAENGCSPGLTFNSSHMIIILRREDRKWMSPACGYKSSDRTRERPQPLAIVDAFGE